MDIVKIVLPALALTLGVLASVYFVFWWWRHNDGRHVRSLLSWAAALFLMYWFQVPAILVGFGKTITVTDFNLFFALTFPITFLALMLVYIGILQIANIRLTKQKAVLLTGWFLAAIVFFAYQFIINKGIITTYPLPLVGNLFYILIRALIIFTLIRLLIRPEMRTLPSILGAAAIIVESILGLARNFFIINQVLIYPPQFWYFAIASSQFFFITQTLSIILLVFGFFFLHRLYHRP